MDIEALQKYQKAGRICAEIREELLGKVRPGMKILDIANYVDREVARKGGKPAFPVNISINEIAAHYTPSYADTREVKEGELVKIDIGVHVDGYIGDMAFTYCSEKHRFIEAGRKALEAVIEISRPGVTVGEIGRVIENAVRANGLGLIVNLTGHTLQRFVFHGSPSIPNVSNNSSYKLKEGEVIAVEPFITESNGFVKESSIVEIYRYLQDKPVRLPEARQIMQIAREEYNSLPFAKRWLLERFSLVKASMALKQLEMVGALETYPVLKEAEGKPIAQTEHTIIISDPPIVTTS